MVVYFALQKQPENASSPLQSVCSIIRTRNQRQSFVQKSSCGRMELGFFTIDKTGYQ
jgi:hypothetical protein